MSYWKLMHRLRIWLGIQCPICHDDLRRVATCGICGKGGIVTLSGKRAEPPRAKKGGCQ